jgi:UDP-2,4-diacetamido-2,4,6-trideoxy-beta-L-altropyranose hydrolase
MTLPATLIVCADAHLAIGTGHLMRSLALAAAWRRGGGLTTFISHCPVPALRQRILAAGAALRALDAPLSDPQRLSAAVAEVVDGGRRTVDGKSAALPPWVVLDGYHFDSACQRAVRQLDVRLLVVDDLAQLPSYHAELIVNQNLGAEEMTYACDADTRLLRGCRYALLRDEFQPWRSWQRITRPLAARLLVTLGGSDPQNVMPRLLQGVALAEVPDLQIRVVIGSANRNATEIRRWAGDCRGSVELLCDVPDMAQQMAWADVALSAAGTTCWELAFMQLPALLTVLADNQQDAALRLDAAGVATNLGDAAQLTPQAVAHSLAAVCRDADRRAEQARRGRALVDGQGIQRLLSAMGIEP